MTTIKLYTQDQQLINAHKVVVAAGDVNSVELQVTFDSSWDAYITKTATFYTSKNSDIVSVLMSNKIGQARTVRCVVPFEVLTESCILYIGMNGISADGERMKTSSVVKYSIVEGAVTGNKTLSPTMNLYQQYLAALKETATPVIESVAASVQALLADEMETLREEAVATNEAARAMLEALNGTVLWENPDPTVKFEATTIEEMPDGTEMDLSEYKRFTVIYRTSNLVDNCEERTISIKNVLYRVSTDYYAYVQKSYERDVTISDTEISIDDAKASNNKNNDCNDYIIPVKIIGYKY